MTWSGITSGEARKAFRGEVSPQMTSHLKPLREFFSEFRAMQVGSRDIEAFKSQPKVAKKANATINRSLQLLSQAYRYALKSDPQKLNRAPMIKRYSEKGNVRKGKFTPAEAEAVFNNDCSLESSREHAAATRRFRVVHIRLAVCSGPLVFDLARLHCLVVQFE